MTLKNGRNIQTDPQGLDFDLFFRGLFNRFRELAQNYCGIEMGIIPERFEFNTDTKKVLFCPENMTFKGQKSVRPKRFNASGEKVSEEYVGGFEGRMSFEGNFTPYLSMISLGQALHIGAKTTAGFGQYRITHVNKIPVP